MPSIACAEAIKEYERRVKWCERWDSLIFFFGAAVVVFLVTAIIFLVRSSLLKEPFTPGLISAFGTIVSSVGIKWVQARRRDHRTEWKQAKEELGTSCKDESNTLAKAKESEPQAAVSAPAKSNNPLKIVVIAMAALWALSVLFLIHQITEIKATKATADYARGKELEGQLAQVTAERDRMSMQAAQAARDQKIADLNAQKRVLDEQLKDVRDTMIRVNNALALHAPEQIDQWLAKKVKDYSSSLQQINAQIEKAKRENK